MGSGKTHWGENGEANQFLFLILMGYREEGR
jgi:hypothetical protein